MSKHTTQATGAWAERVRNRARAYFAHNPGVAGRLPYLHAADAAERALRIDWARAHGFSASECGLFYAEARRALALADANRG